MKIIMGADHAGYELKEAVKQHLKEKGHEVVDLGTDGKESVDYPDYAQKVSHEVLKEHAMGVLCCGTGIGMSLTANRIRGIRAAVCHSDYTAKVAREHNNANIICLGGRTIPPELAIHMVDIFFSTDFSPEERHHRRVDKIEATKCC
ncbi:MAG: ribose 5-phosphate isomerase B [DPANN group archaeon]|nr:ribose 5-phosphate isomerase B [DPANN group archaeon]